MRPIFVEPLTPQSLTVTSAVSEFPAANLLTLQPSEVCRTVSTASDIDIDFAFAAAVQLTTVALLFHTEAQGALELYGASDGASLDVAPRIALSSVFAGTIEPGFGTRLGFLHLTAPASFSHWRLRITGRASMVFEAGRLIVGDAFRPEKSLGFGLQPETTDGGAVRRAAKGARYVDAGPVRPAFTLDFGVVTDDDLKSYLWPLLNRLGQSRPLFFCADPDDVSARELMSIYGLLGRPRPQQHQPLRWRAKLKITGL